MGCAHVQESKREDHGEERAPHPTRLPVPARHRHRALRRHRSANLANLRKESTDRKKSVLSKRLKTHRVNTDRWYRTVRPLYHRVCMKVLEVLLVVVVVEGHGSIYTVHIC